MTRVVCAMATHKYSSIAMPMLLLSASVAFADDQTVPARRSLAEPAIAPAPAYLRGSRDYDASGLKYGVAAVPDYLPPTAPARSWKGFYVGAHLGGAREHRDVSIFQASTGAFLASG